MPVAIADHIHSESQAGPFGQWTFQVCQPPALAHVVESIWEARGTVVHTHERILPSGAIELITNLGPPQWLVRPDGVETFASGATWLSGMQQRPLLVESMQAVHVFGVRLRAAAASHLLATPMDVASGRTIPVRELRRAPATAFADALAGTRRFEDRVVAVCRWIESRCGLCAQPVDYVQWIAERLERSRGTLSIDPLRQIAGVSRKKLAVEFRAQVGTTPKVLARILRFRRARTLLLRGESSFAEVAVRCGYFDQPHMIRDFRALGDMTPADFVATSYPDGNSTSM